MSKRSTWNYPSTNTWAGWSSRRAVDWKTADDCTVREVHIGTTPEPDVLSFVKWSDDMYEKNQDQHATQVISLDVEEIQITQWDYLRITSKNYIGKTIKLSRNLNVCTAEEKEFFKNK